MKSATSSGPTSCWPSGLFQSLAIFAISLFGPIPADAVNPVSSRIWLRISRASAAAEVCKCDRSRYASSSDSGSIISVNLPKIARIRALSA